LIPSLIILWSIVHSVLAYLGFYQNTTSIPPRFGLVLIPVFLILLYSLIKKKSWIIKNRNTKISTLLHAVRLPVELVLHQLFIFKLIPELMTYEGYNFDIIMGISSLFLGFLLFKKNIPTRLLMVWNTIGLVMILAILFMGILSSELPIQLFAFDQPNTALLYFPYILLPATIVPLVIWTHISDLIVLRNSQKTL